MSTRADLALENTKSISRLDDYIKWLRARYNAAVGTDPEAATTLVNLIADLSTARTDLQTKNLTLADGSAATTRALADLVEANQRISDEIAQAKALQETVETAAAIVGIIQRVVGIAFA